MPDNTPNVFSERRPSPMSTSGEDTSASEADVTRSVAGQQTRINMKRAAGNIMDADLEQAALNNGEYARGIRRQLGLADPTTPNPDAKAASEYGIRVDAKPDDYRVDPTTLSHAGVAGDKLGRGLQNLKDLGAAMGFAPELTTPKLNRIAELGVTLHAMTNEQRASWAAEQEDLGLRMAGSEAKLKEWRENAKAMLSVTNAGRNFAESAIALDVWLMRSLWNLKDARDQFKASRPT